MSKYLLSLCVGLLFFSCTSTTETPLPKTSVYYEVPLQLSQYRTLLSPGGIALIPHSTIASMRAGLAGLAIVHAIDREEFYAFDLACPVEPTPWTQLRLSGLELRCPKCESHFDLLSGTGRPLSGPARSPLRSYRIQRLSRQDKLLVTN
ncbi:hypothetical protein [uncultured Porphyromonas sp.]|jgi:putative lipoprotein|uniref:Rieske (2Fe-2S) protein n=1 Tax=uncultured Porphyromonas sp. TaxID=159274 RepID=UPI002626100C|nr:hypothetical protein [uncultured Porphyromonas sp.]